MGFRRFAGPYYLDVDSPLKNCELKYSTPPPFLEKDTFFLLKAPLT